jgi:hypothetical protein
MDEEELMSRLRRIGSQIDQVPEFVMDNARAAFLTRRIDEEFADLVLDSSAEGSQVRGEGEYVRLLSYQRADVLLEVQLDYSGELVSLNGLADGVSGEVELEQSGERRTLPIDLDGRFTAQLPRGSVRFRLLARDGTAVTTGWVLL